jgi:tRNA threonylcarbamoyladenosine biosynthesis protein TsaB
MEPRVLIVETSGRVGAVALAQGDKLLRQKPLDETRRHARDLAPAVRELLNLETWTPRDLQVVIVSRGPGSYTGLRVGIVSAKVWAYATGCALVAVETFAAIAAQVPPGPHGLGSPGDVLADAQQDKLYVQRFVGGVAQSPLAVRTAADWLQQPELPAWVSGPGVRVLRDRVPANCRVVPPEHWDPRPASLLRLGLERYRRGERDDPFTLEPLYLRPSSAEEKWASRSGGG